MMHSVHGTNHKIKVRPPSPITLQLNLYRTDDRCPHNFDMIYKSPSEYISHVLWILNAPKTSRTEWYHTSHLRAACSEGERAYALTHNMCTNCCNIMLSQQSLATIVSEFQRSGSSDTLGEPSRNGWPMHLAPRFCLHLALIESLVHHPQMSRLMVKQTPITKRQFRSMDGTGNMIVMSAHFITVQAANIEKIKMFDPDQRRMYLCKLRTFAVFICGSMRYWGEYDYLFFTKQFIVRMHTIAKKLERIQFRERIEQDHKEAIISTLSKIIGGIGVFCERIWKRTDIPFLGDGNYKSVLNLMILIRRFVHETGYQINREGDIAKRAAKRQLICCWNKCYRMEREIGRAMQMCSGCKMTYYCSRKCQKKAWKCDHRDICQKLSKLYFL